MPEVLELENAGPIQCTFAIDVAKWPIEQAFTLPVRKGALVTDGPLAVTYGTEGET